MIIAVKESSCNAYNVIVLFVVCNGAHIFCGMGVCYLFILIFMRCWIVYLHEHISLIYKVW